MFVMKSNVRSKNMGEYECIDCNEMYHLDEPPEGYSICWDCREERKNETTSKEN